METQSYHTEDGRERHVYFLNVSSKGGTDGTSTARTGATCEASSNATGCGFWETGSSPTGSSLVVSSMAPLNARAADSPGLAEFLAEEPTVPPNPFLGRRSQPSFAAFADAAPLATSVRAGTDGRASDDDGAFSWLRNFLVGVLVVSLLVVVASAGGLIDWTGGAAVELHSSDARPPTTSSDEMEVVDARRFSAAAPQAPVVPDAVDENGAGSQIHGNFTTAGIPSAPSTARIPTVKEEHEADVGSTGSHLPMRMLWKRECGHYFYTYCDSIRQEWYHKPSAHGCVATASDSAHVCNRGANRFVNLESCFASCVHGDRKPDQCFERSLFTGCDREDVVETWWFFDGHRCVRWNFPLGNCPSEQSRVFHTHEQCALECVPDWEARRPSNASAAVRRRRRRRSRRCEAPVAATCSPRQLRYPYFADMHAEGSARCVRASAGNLLTRRCLVGSNRFASLSTCSQFCATRRPAT
ncbi:uncharacterized protein [Dermacentor albipictus]|uniref:uncharacterized protein n=1 Tax=Dermacentor albipictus TaxID=60249 RepID=UPI0038FCBAA1